MKIIDDYIYIKKSGDVVMLIPVKDPWDSLVNSLDKFSEDFMTKREQPRILEIEKIIRKSSS